MVLTLLVVTLASATAVGLVYKVTEGPIAEANAAVMLNALQEVLPPFDNNPVTEAVHLEIDGLPVDIYTGRNGDEITGYAIMSSSMKGFGGEIAIMAGFLPNGEIVRIVTLSHNETPGLGDKIENGKSGFAYQFEGRNPSSFILALKKDGGNVDAITAATISSRAYTDALTRAYNALQEVRKGGNNE